MHHIFTVWKSQGGRTLPIFTEAQDQSNAIGTIHALFHTRDQSREGGAYMGFVFSHPLV